MKLADRLSAADSAIRGWIPDPTARRLSRLRRSLVGRDRGTLVCGPFLGEPGFETLYWIPFLRRLLGPILSGGGDVVLISRGGVEALYGDLVGRGARYIDVLDLLDPEEFLRMEAERTRDHTAKNQKQQVGDLESRILAEAGLGDATPLLPPAMFSLLAHNPHEQVCDWTGWPDGSTEKGREDVTLVKFWFGAQLPPDDENIRRLEALIDRLAQGGRIAAIANPYSLDPSPAFDRPFEELVERLGLETMTTTSYRTNLGDQIAMIGRSRRLVATYGGLAYLSLYTNTPVVTYYSDPKIVFSGHFRKSVV